MSLYGTKRIEQLKTIRKSIDLFISERGTGSKADSQRVADLIELVSSVLDLGIDDEREATLFATILAAGTMSWSADPARIASILGALWKQSDEWVKGIHEALCALTGEDYDPTDLPA